MKTAKKVFDDLEPKDIVWKHAWLFKNPWVEYSWEDIHDDNRDLDEREKRISWQRQEAVREAYESENLAGVVRLALSGNASQVVGNVLANIFDAEDDQLAFVKAIISNKEFMPSTKL